MFFGSVGLWGFFWVFFFFALGWFPANLGLLFVSFWVLAACDCRSEVVPSSDLIPYGWIRLIFVICLRRLIKSFFAVKKKKKQDLSWV